MKKFYNHMAGPEIIKLVNCEYFVSISLKNCFGYSKESSYPGSSFEYPQHIFWLTIEKYFSLSHSNPVKKY